MATHGGKREGAGRPPLPEGTQREQHSIRLEPAVVAALQALGGGSLTTGIERLYAASVDKKKLIAHIKRQIKKEQEIGTGYSEAATNEGDPQWSAIAAQIKDRTDNRAAIMTDLLKEIDVGRFDVKQGTEERS